MSKVSGEYKREIEELKFQIENLQNTVGVKEIERRDAEIEELEEELQVLKRVHQNLSENVEGITSQVHAKNATIEAVKKDAETLQTRVNELTAIQKTTEQVNKELSDVVTQQRTLIADLQAQLNGIPVGIPVVEPMPTPVTGSIPITPES